MNRTVPDDITAVRILIADSQRLMQWGLRLLIDQQLPRSEVVGTVSSIGELLSVCLSTQPDVIVLDHQLEEEDTLPIIPLLTATGARVVIYASRHSLGGIDISEMAGAHALVYKEEAPETLTQAIAATCLGQQWLSGQRDDNK